jgi:hypothetical protein
MVDAIITKRVVVPIAALPKPSAVWCLHCAAPMIAERVIFRCEQCRDAADVGAVPKVAARAGPVPPAVKSEIRRNLMR